MKKRAQVDRGRGAKIKSPFWGFLQDWKVKNERELRDFSSFRLTHPTALGARTLGELFPSRSLTSLSRLTRPLRFPLIRLRVSLAFRLEG